MHANAPLLEFPERSRRRALRRKRLYSRGTDLKCPGVTTFVSRRPPSRLLPQPRAPRAFGQRGDRRMRVSAGLLERLLRQPGIIGGARGRWEALDIKVCELFVSSLLRREHLRRHHCVDHHPVHTLQLDALFRRGVPAH